jgi:predicted restriction endonuclease
LEACHIKPFSGASDAERSDAYNGLCLAAHIHRAFDAHLIGFTPSGEICFSDRLSQEDRKRMQLDGTIKIKLTDKHLPYIADRYALFLAANLFSAARAVSGPQVVV